MIELCSRNSSLFEVYLKGNALLVRVERKKKKKKKKNKGKARKNEKLLNIEWFVWIIPFPVASSSSLAYADDNHYKD